MSNKKKTSLFREGSIPYKMLADLKSFFKSKTKFDKKSLIKHLPILLFAWGGNKIYCAYRVYGLSMEMMSGLKKMFSNPGHKVFFSNYVDVCAHMCMLSHSVVSDSL